MQFYASRKQFFVCENQHFPLILSCLFVIACKWNNRLCKLYLHYEDGFALYNDSESTQTNTRLLWKESFEKLRSSSDDSNHLLTLDFQGEEGVMVCECVLFFVKLNCCLCLIRNCISKHHQNRLSSIYMHFFRLKQHALLTPNKICSYVSSQLAQFINPCLFPDSIVSFF